MRGAVDFATVNRAALQRLAELLPQWLPGGRREGHEYVVRNPKRPDQQLGSFKINLTTGAWSDFATGDKGGDPVALVAFLRGIAQGKAARELAAELGAEGDAKRNGRQAPSSPADWRPVLPVPASAGPPPKKHPTRGAPSQTWFYRDADRKLLHVVMRFRPRERREGHRSVELVSGPKEWTRRMAVQGTVGREADVWPRSSRRSNSRPP